MITKVLRLVVIVFLFHLPSLSPASDQSEVDEDILLLELPSISANFREFHEASESEISLARIHLSPHGMRVEQKMDGAKTAVYHDFRDGRAWFLNLDRNIAHEIPALLGSEVENVDVVDPHFKLGFIDTKPCSNLIGRIRQQVFWRGRLVSLWDCYIAPGEAVAMQHFDETIGLVVRSEYVDGVVMQLEDIQYRQFDKLFFVPGEKFRSVSLQELMTGAPKIETYD